MIIWLTGQSGAGKTAIALQFLKDHQDWFHIDGDDIRDLFNNKDYSEQGRRKNIELAQHLAQYLYSKGQNVIVSLIAPYRDQREYFKEKIGKDLVEIFLHTDNIRGKEIFFVKDYEPPIKNFINLDTSNNIDVTMNELLIKLKNRNIFT